jgi:phosphoribosylformimino-5-aminoimidazole carboxamide ribonucleotide (ProFAR) isomerase
MGGEAVRLEKGDFATKKVYAKDPAEKAAEFRDAGATLLHVVDLDGAKAGWPVNLDTVAAICRVKGIEVELGGGIRTLLPFKSSICSSRCETRSRFRMLVRRTSPYTRYPWSRRCSARYEPS